MILTSPTAILKRMATIAANDMMRRGTYLTPKPVDHELVESGAVCRGHQACAIGSLWLAAGVEPVRARYPFSAVTDLALPGVDANTMPAFLADKPALRAAFDALNAEAEELAAELDLELCYGNDGWSGALESLFEDHPDAADRDTMLGIIRRAARRLA